MSEIVEFVVDLPVEECRQRLEGQHEKASIFAPRGQTRISVSISSLDLHTYQFTIKRIGKSSFNDKIGMSGFKGALYALSPSSTSVSGQQYINWTFLVLAQFLIGFLSFSSLINVLILNSPSSLEQSLYLLLLMVVNAISFILMYLWATWRARVMEKLVLKILDYEPPPEYEAILK